MSNLNTLQQIWVNVNLKYKHKHMANHGGKRSRRRYMEKKGFIKPKDSALLSRSEGGTRYEYDNQIANMFAGWSSKQRDAGLTPTFRDFYNRLPDDHKKVIKVTEVFKSN